LAAGAHNAAGGIVVARGRYATAGVTLILHKDSKTKTEPDER
jgi:hypothetical protein